MYLSGKHSLGSDFATMLWVLNSVKVAFLQQDKDGRQMVDLTSDRRKENHTLK